MSSCNHDCSSCKEKCEKSSLLATPKPTTKIRKMIKNNENTQEYLNPKVYEYIKKNNLYI